MQRQSTYTKMVDMIGEEPNLQGHKQEKKIFSILSQNYLPEIKLHVKETARKKYVALLFQLIFIIQVTCHICSYMFFTLENSCNQNRSEKKSHVILVRKSASQNRKHSSKLILHIYLSASLYWFPALFLRNRNFFSAPLIRISLKILVG